MVAEWCWLATLPIVLCEREEKRVYTNKSLLLGFMDCALKGLVLEQSLSIAENNYGKYGLYCIGSIFLASAKQTFHLSAFPVSVFISVHLSTPNGQLLDDNSWALIITSYIFFNLFHPQSLELSNYCVLIYSLSNRVWETCPSPRELNPLPNFLVVF